MTRPTTSCRASSPYSHHQPVTRAVTAPTPTVAWRKRGARASMTSVSAYGSAVGRERAVVEDMAGPSWCAGSRGRPARHGAGAGRPLSTGLGGGEEPVTQPLQVTPGHAR